MMDEKIKNKVESLRNLKPFKNKTEAELVEIATKKVEEETPKSGIEWTGVLPSEEKEANHIFNCYIEQHEIEGFNDLENLKTLVYNQILENRMRTKFEEKDSKKKQKIPSTYQLQSLTNLQRQILELKSRLGLNDERKEGWLEFWKRLLKKMKQHAVTHRGSFTFKCGKCGQMYILARKIEDYNTFDFNMFRGTFVYSEEVFKMIDEKLIDYDRASKILFGTGKEYLQGMYEQIYLKEKRENENKQK